MIILKQVIHDVKTNSVEATWVDRTIMPDVEVPEEVKPDTEGQDGEVIPGEIIPAHTVKGEVVDVPVRCHSYADVQMDMLRDDLGDGAAEYEELIALVESGIKPVTPPTLEELIPQYESALDNYLDSVAQKYRFKNRENLSLRAGYPSAYQPLALAYAQWMDSCNVIAYQGLQDVMDGKRTLPTLDGFIAELPEFVFP